MICPTCERETAAVNHNGRGWRCRMCWAEWPAYEPDTPLTPEWIVNNTPDLTKLGIDGEQMLALHDLEIVTFADVADAAPETLRQVTGIGPKTAAHMQAAAEEYYEQPAFCDPIR